MLEGLQDSADMLTFSEDNNTLAAVSWDETIRIWDVVSGAVVRCKSAPCGELFHFAHIPEQNAWLVVDRKHGLRIFGQSQAMDRITSLPKRSTVTAVGSCRKTGVLAIARTSGHVELWRTARKSETRRTGHSFAMKFTRCCVAER